MAIDCTVCTSCSARLKPAKPHIDLLIALDYDFRSAVTVLERWLDQYQAQDKKMPPAPAP